MGKKAAKKHPSVFHYEQLEQRILFSGDIAPGVDTTDAVEHVIAADEIDDVPVESEAVPETTVQTETQQQWELVLVNGNVADYEQLIAGLQSEDGDRIFEVVVLDADRGGIAQVSDILSERSNLAALHIISHGDDGRVNLGDTWLDGQMLQQKAAQVASWGEALTEEGDILLYGCNVANEARPSFIGNLAELTGADVAASDDVTGHAELGGDWQLESQTGDITTSIAPTVEAIKVWQSTLESASFQEGTDSYSGTLDTYLDENNPASNAAGAYSSISVDLQDVGGLETQGLIRFDNLFGNSAGQIPLGSTIHSASLTLEITNESSNDASITLHRMLVGWDELSSWDSMTNGLQSPSEYAVTASSTLPNPDALGTSVFAGLASDLQNWSDGGTNYGWAILSSSTNGWEFNSSKFTTVSARPQLQVNYTAPTVNQAPTDIQISSTSEGGLSLNEDGGNDAYLVADDGDAILGGLNQFTAEFSFLSNGIEDSPSLLSYATATEDNELALMVGTSTGNVHLYVGGNNLNTGYSFAPLNDGAVHSLAVTWDNTNGDWSLVVDGVLQASDTGHAMGVTIDVGGTLVVGNEQDAFGSGFSTGQELAGVIYDVRIFDDVRTDQEIATSYRSNLPYDTAGLIANWRFDQLSADNVVTDTVSGNNLTLKHTSESGFSPSTPSLTFAIDENATTGTVVGTVQGFDAERDTLVASLLAADPNLTYSAETGKFYKVVGGAQLWSDARAAAESTGLNGVNGQLATIHSAYENELIRDLVNTTIGYDAWIGGTDSTVEGEWRWVDGGSEAGQFWQGDETGTNTSGAFHNFQSGQPNDAGNNEDVLHMDEATGLWLDADHDTHNFYGYVIEWDADAVLDATQALTYSMQSQTVNGAFAINADSGVITVAGGALLDYETNATHTLNIRVTDVDSNVFVKAITIEISDANKTPINTVPGAQTTSEDTTLVFSTGTGNLITVSDDAGQSPTVVLSVVNGSLTPNAAGGAGITGSGTSTVTLSGTVSQINATLDGLLYDPISDWSGGDTLTITTTDGAIYSLNLDANLQGYYEFTSGSMAVDSSPSGTNMLTNIGTPTVVNDSERGDVLSLDGSGEALEFSGTLSNPANVTLAAWVKFSATDIWGGEVITIDNDVALRVNDSGSDGLSAYFWDGATHQFVTSSVTIDDGQWHHIAFSFDDTANSQRLYVDGVLAASTALTDSINYTGWFPQTRIGTHANDADTQFDFNGLIDEARIYDRALSTIEIASLAAAPVTIYDTDSVSITINAVNDAPVLDNSAFLTMTTINEDDTANNGHLVSEILASDGAVPNPVTDADTSALEGIAIHSITSPNGTWEYNTGSGGWTSCGTVSWNSALLLRATDRLRFVPNGETGGSPSVLFTAWDQTSDNAGDKVDTSVYDDAGAFSFAVDAINLTVTDTNDAPIIDLNGTNGLGNDFAATFTEDGGAVGVVDTDAVLSDVDSTSFQNLSVNLTDFSGGTDERILIDGYTFYYGVSDTVVRTIGTTDIELDFDGSGFNIMKDGSGTIPIADLQSLFEGIAYDNASQNPTQADRIVEFTLFDNSGLSSSLSTSTITVLPDNDEPVITASAGVTAYTEQQTAKVIDAGITLVDPDGFDGTDPSDQYVGVVQITGNYEPADILGFNNTTKIQGVLTNDILVLSVIGGPSATIADFQTAFRSVTFYNGSDGPSELDRTISFSFDDGVDSSSITTKIVQLTAANDPPVLNAIGNQTVDEGSTLSFTAGATDSDLPTDTLTYSLDGASQALGMTINSSTGAFNWTPTESQGGLTPSVTITVSDSSQTDSETFTITVTDNNTDPVLGAIGNQSVDEGSTLSFTVGATDSDLPTDTLTYSLDGASQALGMTINSSTGAFSWTPSEGQGGLTPSVTITVFDGSQTDSETFTITVNDTNTAPVLGAIGNQSADEGSTLSFTVGATDSDLPTDTLTYSLDGASKALGMSINSSTGAFSWTPTESQGGLTPSVTITVSDGSQTDSETFTITVNDINTVPVLGAIGNQSVDEGSTLGFTVGATDSDLPTDTLTYSLDSASQLLGITINSSTGAFSWTPSEGQGGLTPSVTITVSDGNQTDSETFTITVNTVNNNDPVAVNDSITVDEGGTVTMLDNGATTILANDTDADMPDDTLTVTVETDVNYGRLTLNANGTFSYTHDGSENFSDRFLYTVSDANGGITASGTVTINIHPVNDAPHALNMSIDGHEDVVYTGHLPVASDAEGDRIVYLLDTEAMNGRVLINSAGSFSYTPDLNIHGPDSFTYSVSDTNGGSNTYTVSVNIAARNDAPVFASDGLTAGSEHATYRHTIVTTDVDGDALTISATTMPGWLSLVDNGDGTATLSGTPSQNEVGHHHIVLQVFDGMDTSSQNLSLTVSAAADPPLEDETDAADTDDNPVNNPNDDVDPDTIDLPDEDDTEKDNLLDTPEPFNVQMPTGQEDTIAFDQNLQNETVTDIVYFSDEEKSDQLEQENRADRALDDIDLDLYRKTFFPPTMTNRYAFAKNNSTADEPHAQDKMHLDDVNMDNPDVMGAHNPVHQSVEEVFDSELRNHNTKSKIVTITAASFTAGIVTYLLRAGSLVASLMSSMPLWRGFDPIAVFPGRKKRKQSERGHQDSQPDEAASESLFEDEGT